MEYYIPKKVLHIPKTTYVRTDVHIFECPV